MRTPPLGNPWTMFWRRPRGTSALALTAVLTLSACDLATRENFPSPLGPPASCTMTSAIVGCEGGSQGYACTSSRPDAGDMNLVCSDGTPGVGGATLYCCAPYATYFSECHADTSVAGCANDALGFACTGETSPSDADATLACSAPVKDGGTTAYCCSSEVPAPTCGPDPTVTSCPGASIGYSCVGGDAPNRSDAAFICTPTGAAAGAKGSSPFCCLSFAQSSGTCVENGAAGCANGWFGFSCAGAMTPEQVNASLSCQPGAAGDQGQAFCCQLGPI